MSWVELAQIVAKFLYPFPYITAGMVLIKYELSWTTSFLMLLLLLAGESLASFAYMGGLS